MSRAYALPIFRLVCCALALTSLEARAIPAFARKYGTSCQTCHTVFPKLNPFGEAFRRRGYRFPGVDADAIKDQPIPLGQEAQARAFPKAIWPGGLPTTPPLAAGFEGQVALHPDPNSGGAAADGKEPVSLRDLGGTVHVWAGGSYDEWITFLAELTASTSKGFQLEVAQVHFNDLLGPPNLLNLVVGQGQASLGSFAPSSSYLVDDAMPSSPVAALYLDLPLDFALDDNSAGLELTGMLKGRLDYALGVNAGVAPLQRPTENFYARLGVKLGGMGLDGSNGGGAADPSQPGAETALTVDLFGYRIHSKMGSLVDARPLDDVAWVGGAAVRAQLRGVELDSGLYLEHHQSAQFSVSGRTGLTMWVHYDELSWIALPWLVPALRFELFELAPDGGTTVWDAKVLPGVAALVRPNLKLLLLAQFESAFGAPPFGWSQAGGYAFPSPGHEHVAFENEAIWVKLATAF